MIFSLHQMLLGISYSERQTVEPYGTCGRTGKIEYFVGVQTHERKSQLGIRTCTWEDNIKMDLNKMLLKTVNYGLGTSGGLLWVRNEL